MNVTIFAARIAYKLTLLVIHMQSKIPPALLFLPSHSNKIPRSS